METVGKRLRRIREEKEVSKQSLSELLSCSQSAIGNYENDIRNLSIDNIIAVCNYLNITSDYLLGLTKTNDKDDISSSPRTVSMKTILNDIQKTQEEINSLIDDREYYLRLAFDKKLNKDAQDCIAALDACKTSLENTLNSISNTLNNIAKIKEKPKH